MVRVAIPAAAARRPPVLRFMGRIFSVLSQHYNNVQAKRQQTTKKATGSKVAKKPPAGASVLR